MAMNFKKALLTGTALVAVSMAHAGAANAAEVAIGGQTLSPGSVPALNGNWLRGNGTIGLDLQNQDAAMGNPGSDTAIETDASSNIYIFDSTGNNGKTLTLHNGAGGADAIWTRGAANTTNIYIGKNTGGIVTGTANVVVNGTTRTDPESSTNIEVSSGSKITFDSTSVATNTVNLGDGTLTMSGSSEAVFGGNSAQTMHSAIAGSGAIKVSNTAGTTFAENINASGMTIDAGAKSTVSKNLSLGVAGVTLSAPDSELVLNGATLQTITGPVTGSAANGKLTINNASAAGVVFGGIINAKTLALDTTTQKVVFNNDATFADGFSMTNTNVLHVNNGKTLTVNGNVTKNVTAGSLNFDGGGGNVGGTGELTLTNVTSNFAGTTSTINNKVTVEGTIYVNNNSIVINGNGSVLNNIVLSAHDNSIKFGNATGDANKITVNGTVSNTGTGHHEIGNGRVDYTHADGATKSIKFAGTGAVHITADTTVSTNIDFQNNAGTYNIDVDNATYSGTAISTGSASGAGQGTMNFNGGTKVTVSGNLGEETKALNTVNFNGTGTGVALNASVVNNDIFADNIIVKTGDVHLQGNARGELKFHTDATDALGKFIIADGKNITSANNTITGAAISAADAGDGTVEFLGSSIIKGTVGAGTKIGKLDIQGDNNTTVTFQGTVNAANLAFTNGGNKGKAQFEGATTIDSAIALGNGEIAVKGATFTATGGITGAGTLTLVDAATYTGAASSVANLNVSGAGTSTLNSALTVDTGTEVDNTTLNVTVNGSDLKALTLKGANAAITGNDIAVTTITNTATTGSIANKVTASGITAVTSGTLTLSGLGSSLDGGVDVANGGKLALQTGLSTIGSAGVGAVTGLGTLEIGTANTAVQISTATIDIANINYEAAGQITLMTPTTLGSAVNFKGHNGNLLLSGATSVTKAITTTTNNTGNILTGAAASLAFEENVGAAGAALNSVSLNSDTTFKGELHTKTLATGNQNVTLKGTTNVEDGISTTGLLTLDNAPGLTLSGGIVTVGALTSTQGANVIVQQVNVTNATTITAGSLDIGTATSTLNTVALNANTLTFGGSTVGAVTGTGGTLILTNNTATAVGKVGDDGAALNTVRIAGTGVMTFSDEFHATTLEMAGGGTANLSAISKNIGAQGINFSAGNGTVSFGDNFTYIGTATTANADNGKLSFGTGATLSGTIGGANKLGSLDFRGTGTVTNNVNAHTINILGGDVAMAGGTIASNINFSGDHKLTLTGTEEITGNVTTNAHGNGTIDFTPGFAKITGDFGTAGASLKDLKLNENATITGAVHAAKLTELGKYTLNVGQSFTTRAGDTLTFYVDSQTTSGNIQAGGPVTLNADTKVIVTVDTNVYIPEGQKMTLIDGTGGTGVSKLNTGNLTTISTAVLHFHQDTTNTEDFVVIARREALSSGSTGSGGGGAVGDMLDQLGGNGDADVNALQIRLANFATMEEVTQVLQTLTPPANAANVASMTNVANSTSTIINNRLATTRAGTGISSGNAYTPGSGMDGAHFWLQAFGGKADQDLRGGIAGYDADTYGMVAGVDNAATDRLRVGVAVAYANTDIDNDAANLGNTEMDSYQASLYADYDLGSNTFLTGQLGYIRSNIDTLRLNVGGLAGNSARGEFAANQFVARAELGRDIVPGGIGNMKLTPSLFTNLNHINFSRYTETGAGGLGLTNVDSESMNLFEVGINLKSEWAFEDGMGGWVKPNIHGGFRYDFANDKVQTSAQLVGGGAAFKTEGFDPAHHTFNGGVGLAWEAGNNWELTTSYDYEYKEDYSAHSGFIRAGYRF